MPQPTWHDQMHTSGRCGWLKPSVCAAHDGNALARYHLRGRQVGPGLPTVACNIEIRNPACACKCLVRCIRVFRVPPRQPLQDWHERQAGTPCADKRIRDAHTISKTNTPTQQGKQLLTSLRWRCVIRGLAAILIDWFAASTARAVHL